MHYTHEEEEARRAEIDAAKATRSSAEAPSKVAGSVSSLAVRTGSLWVSAGLLEQLLRAWERGAHERREAARKHGNDGLNHSITDALYDQAQTLDDCANELHLLLVDATVRQPTENIRHEPRPTE